MKKIFFISAMAIIAACTEIPVEPNVEKVPVNPDAISFTADIQETTRATDTDFSRGDEISLFATTKNNLEYTNYAQNVKYTYADGLFSTTEDLRYPDNDTYLSFYAVYPYMESYSPPKFTFAVKLDQSTNESYAKSDFMTASQVAKNEEVVDLTFSHRMVKIIIKLNSANLPVGDQSVTFNNVLYNVSADLSDNTFTGAGAASVVTACPNGSNSFKVILPPQTVRKGTDFVKVKIGDDTYTWSVEKDLILSSGVEYTYTLTLKENSVSFTSNINPWNSPSDIQSVIPQEYIDLLSNYIPIYDGTTPPNIEGVWLMSPYELYYDSQGATKEDFKFADNYLKFYNQGSNNTINMMATQNLGDLSVADGVFVSGSGNNFTIYFNEYRTHSDGSWLIMASVISGTKSGNTIKNLKDAFIVLDDYDPNDTFMDVGQFRVIEDGDYSSGKATWPLDTRSSANGELKYIKR